MATSTYNKFNAFAEDINEKVHNLASDALTFALTNAANAPVATNSTLSNLTQIAYTNLSSRVLTGVTSTRTGGTYKLDAANLTLTASGGAVAAFRYLCLYNDTGASDQLIAWWDNGADLTLADGDSLEWIPNAAGIFTLA